MTDPVLQLRLVRLIDSAPMAAPKAADGQDFPLELLDRLLAGLSFGALPAALEDTGDLPEDLAGDPAPELEVSLAEDDAMPAVDGDMAPPVPQMPMTAVDLPPLFSEDSGQVTWSAAHDLLYEDILWLFKTGDNEGAIEALGRLMDLADGTSELTRFLEINQKKLLGLFEKLVGPLSGVPRLSSDNDFEHRYFNDPAATKAFLKEVSAGPTIADLAANSGAGLVRTYSTLFRLGREGMVENPAAAVKN